MASIHTGGREYTGDSVWQSILQKPHHLASIRVQVQLIVMLQMFSPLNDTEIKGFSHPQFASIECDRVKVTVEDRPCSVTTERQ